MELLLPPDLPAFVTKKVESGSYPTANDVIQAGLRLLLDQEVSEAQRLDELRREIALGIEEADRGEVAPLDARGILDLVRTRGSATTSPCRGTAPPGR